MIPNSLDERLLADVVAWFAARTQQDVTTLRAEATVEAAAERLARPDCMSSA